MIILLVLFLCWLAWLWFKRLDITDPATGNVYLRRFHLKRGNWPWITRVGYALWRRRIISDDTAERFYDFAHQRIFLHRIYTRDPDRHLHNHPWSLDAWSKILWGGYIHVFCEHYPDKGMTTADELEFFQRGDRMELAPWHYHKITYVQPNTWTLFFAGMRDREWGFLVDGVHVDYRKYLGLPEDHKLED